VNFHVGLYSVHHKDHLESNGEMLLITDPGLNCLTQNFSLMKYHSVSSITYISLFYKNFKIPLTYFPNTL